MNKSFTELLLGVIITITFGVVSSVSAGTIRGVIQYDGDVPKFREIKMDADPICLSHHTEAVMPQTLVLGEGKTLGNVFVYIKGGIFDNKFEPPVEPVIVDQKGCMYDPHVIGVMVGQPLKILNPDGTLHNVHALSKVNPEFNLAMPKFRRETTKVFDKPEFMFPMKCDVHPWMSAWISVMDHPFFAVTKEDGQFEIKDVPEGDFNVVAWHEKLGTQTSRVVMGKGGGTEVNFTFSKPSQ